jgi:hypothetical protein
MDDVTIRRSIRSYENELGMKHVPLNYKDKAKCYILTHCIVYIEIYEYCFVLQYVSCFYFRSKK